MDKEPGGFAGWGLGAKLAKIYKGGRVFLPVYGITFICL